jgi:hypothetical protein
MSLLGKRNERCQRVTWSTAPGKTDGKDKTLSIEIDQVDHVKRFDYYSKDIKEISEQKDYLLLNWGACVDIVFLEKRVKRDKEKQPMKSRVRSAD